MKRFGADDKERRQWQDPEEILTRIGIGPGMIFADVGCNEGYFTIPAARRVGPTGMVYGVDINAGAVDSLRRRMAEMGIHHVSLKAGEAEHTVFCTGCADVVFYGIDLHDFRDPARVLENAKKMLRPSGRLIDLDWKDEAMALGPPLEKRFSMEKARGLIETAGFTVRSAEEAGPFHYLIVAGLP